MTFPVLEITKLGYLIFQVSSMVLKQKNHDHDP